MLRFELVFPFLNQEGQLLNISAERENFIFPFFHTLMNGRKEGLYQAICLKSNEFSPSLQPQIVMANYETAIDNAMKEVFPALRIMGRLNMANLQDEPNGKRKVTFKQNCNDMQIS